MVRRFSTRIPSSAYFAACPSTTFMFCIARSRGLAGLFKGKSTHRNDDNVQGENAKHSQRRKIFADFNNNSSVSLSLAMSVSLFPRISCELKTMNRIRVHEKPTHLGCDKYITTTLFYFFLLASTLKSGSEWLEYF